MCVCVFFWFTLRSLLPQLSAEFGKLDNVPIKSFDDALQWPIDVWITAGFSLSQDQINRAQHTGAKVSFHWV